MKKINSHLAKDTDAERGEELGIMHSTTINGHKMLVSLFPTVLHIPGSSWFHIVLIKTHCEEKYKMHAHCVSNQ